MLQLDWVAYGERLLGPADWTSAASVAGLYGKAQALLPSDLLVVPVARVAAAHVAARADLRVAVTARPLGAQPLRALLADATLRTMLATTLTRIADGVGATLLALGLPAAETLAAAAAAAVGLPPPVVDEDTADDAALYVADFLRAFAAVPLTALRLGDTRFVGLDAPIVRVAAHYGWKIIRDAEVTIAAIPVDIRPEAAVAYAANLRGAA